MDRPMPDRPQRPWQVIALSAAWVAAAILPVAAAALLLLVVAFAVGWTGDPIPAWAFPVAILVAAIAIVPLWVAAGIWRGRHGAWLAGGIVAAIATGIAGTAVLIASAGGAGPVLAALEIALALALLVVLHVLPSTRRWVDRRPPRPVPERGPAIAGGVIVATMAVVAAIGVGALLATPEPSSEPSGKGDGGGGVGVTPIPGPPMIRASSSTAATSAPEMALDGRLDTTWNAGTGAPSWWEIDLGKVQTLTMLELVVEQSPPGPTVHVVFAAGEGQPYREVHRFDGDTDAGQTLRFAPLEPVADVRFIRVETRDSPSWVAWREVFFAVE